MNFIERVQAVGKGRLLGVVKDDCALQKLKWEELRLAYLEATDEELDEYAHDLEARGFGTYLKQLALLKRTRKRAANSGEWMKRWHRRRKNKE